MRKYRRSDRLKAQKEAHHETELHDDQLETITGGARNTPRADAVDSLVIWTSPADVD